VSQGKYGFIFVLTATS